MFIAGENTMIKSVWPLMHRAVFAAEQEALGCDAVLVVDQRIRDDVGSLSQLISTRLNKRGVREREQGISVQWGTL
jgi:hypothetical protein